MNKGPLLCMLAFVVACATTQQSESYNGNRVVFEGFGIDEVREAARSVVEDVTFPKSCRPGKTTCRPPVVRVHDNLVVTDGRIGVCGKHVACGESPYPPYFRTGTPQTTIRVELEDLGADTVIEVDIDFETAYCIHDPLVQFEADCMPEVLGSNGVLEQEIIAGIRAALTGESDDKRVSLGS